MRLYLLVLVLLSMFSGCNETPPDDNTPPNSSCKQARLDLVYEIKNDMKNISYDTPYTLKIRSDDGFEFINSLGDSTAQTIYQSASTSKLIAATVILDVVQDTNLSLDSRPQDFISQWPKSGELSKITLSQLLSFSSGLNEKPSCMGIFMGSKDFEQCVLDIASQNQKTPVEAGTTYFYGPMHLQVAALMAIKASNSTSWDQLFKDFKDKTLLFQHSSYDIPSITNPRIAGGMHYSADDYVEFLDKLYHNKILNQDLQQELFKDHIKNVTILNSPALDGLNEDWHYSYGNWIECHSTSFDCEDNVERISSPGLFGAYPFIDFKHKYYGILAREGGFTTFTKGYEIFEQLSPKLEKLVQMKCK